MVKIQLNDIGKKFSRNEWVFRGLTHAFDEGKSYAITGNNGSGKSTLIKAISGIIPLTNGTIEYSKGNKTIDPDQIFKHITWAAPYLDLVEEFTLAELVSFHFRFKNPLNNITENQLIDLLYLTHSKKKKIKEFSSGMKQRLKIGLAIYSDVDITLLDEPTSNLDAQGIQWYQEHVQQALKKRIVIIASNQPEEYTFCDTILKVQSKGIEIVNPA